MKKNYMNIKTNRKAYGVYVLSKKDLEKVTKLFEHANNPIDFTIYSEELEFSTRDEYGFDSSSSIMVGDYVVCDEGWIRIYSPTGFSHIYRMMPVSLWEGEDGWTNGDIEEVVKANLLKLQEDDNSKQFTSEGYPRKIYKREEWFGADVETPEVEKTLKNEEGESQYFFQAIPDTISTIDFMQEYLKTTSNPGLPFVHSVKYGVESAEDATAKMEWYSEQPWWKKIISDSQKTKFQESYLDLIQLINDKKGNEAPMEEELKGHCGNPDCSCGGETYVDKDIVALEAYRITEDFDEWSFAKWLTPGDKFTLKHNMVLKREGYLDYTNPVVKIYDPKVEREARVGDIVIKVAPHRYAIEACVNIGKDVD